MSRFYEGVSAPRWPFWRARHRGGSVTRTGGCYVGLRTCSAMARSAKRETRPTRMGIPPATRTAMRFHSLS
eukprot:4846402-Pyramimonas_sp.AAC.1